MAKSFIWYDLETFGRDPRRSRIAQFAAIRTDEELNEIDEPISWFCQPANDLLPSPEAALITNISPQQALRDGVCEAEFFAKVHDELINANTCAVGYNSIRFDDEFIRFGLYRNFYDAYEREYRNGNSRWDLLDFMRFAHAMRPEGIIWPKREDGFTSFKLEHLAEANGTRAGTAHEALSDVRALIGLARKLRAAQPKLWNYYLDLRSKEKVMALLDVFRQTPVLHISGQFSAENCCGALVIPLASHPDIKNRAIVFDLSFDPADLIELDAADIAERVFIRQIDLPEGMHRIPLKEIHGNRCPVVLPLAHCRDEDFIRLKIDKEKCLANAALLQKTPAIAEKIRQVFSQRSAYEKNDADGALYDGFASDSDKRFFNTIRSSSPAQLKNFLSPWKKGSRYDDLLFRYRARNWPDSLSTEEIEQWNQYRLQRLAKESSQSEYSFESYYLEIQRCRVSASPEQQSVLDQLQVWGQSIEASL
jgi:exodeoxyribonuclease I